MVVLEMYVVVPKMKVVVEDMDVVAGEMNLLRIYTITLVPNPAE